MSKGLVYPSHKIICLTIAKVFSEFGREFKFHRLLTAVNAVLFHLGHTPIDEGSLSWRCDRMVRRGALLRVDTWPNIWKPSGPGLRPGNFTVAHGRFLRIIDDRYYSGPYDPWSHISYRMDPLHRLAAAL